MTKKTLYASASGFTNILSINISTAHSAATALANIQCESTTVSIGDLISLDVGYDDDHAVIFTGYVKNIIQTIPDNVFTVVANDVLVRAVDYFIASSNPLAPFSRFNITAEQLVQDVLALSGITSYNYDATSFTFAIEAPVEINLTGAYDYCKNVADILTWHLYANMSTGVVNFVDRKPYVMGGDSPIGTIANTGGTNNILDFEYRESDRDLRNKVLVYGKGSIVGEDSAVSPYLPSGFYKTVVFADPYLIDSQNVADLSAQYNLAKLNRLTKEISTRVLGDPSFVARSVLTVSESFSGISSENWYIFSAEHNWSKSGYSVQMELRS